MFKKLLVIFLLSLGFSAPLFAREATDEENRAISQGLNEYLRAIETHDARKSLTMMPPKVFAAIAKEMNMQPDAYMEIAIGIENRLAKEVVYSDFHYTLDALDLISKNGITFAVIDFDFIMRTYDGKWKVTASTIAINDGGKWYFLSIEPHSKDLYLSVYPMLSDVEFRKSTREVLQE